MAKDITQDKEELKELIDVYNEAVNVDVKNSLKKQITEKFLFLRKMSLVTKTREEYIIGITDDY